MKGKTKRRRISTQTNVPVSSKTRKRFKQARQPVSVGDPLITDAAVIDELIRAGSANDLSVMPVDITSIHLLELHLSELYLVELEPRDLLRMQNYSHDSPKKLPKNTEFHMEIANFTE